MTRQFFTSFCWRFSVNLSDVLGIVGVWLDLDDFRSSRLLETEPTFKAKVDLN